MSRPIQKRESRPDLDASSVDGRVGGGDGSSAAPGTTTRERWRHLVALLEEIGAGDVKHSRATLLDHLVGTAEILERWGANENAVKCGLFHSIYGTQAFEYATLPETDRPRVREAIGTRAERLAFLFCTLERSSVLRTAAFGAPYVGKSLRGEDVPLEREDVRDLVQNIWANELEQRGRIRMTPPAREREARALEATRAWLPEVAHDDLARGLAKGGEIAGSRDAEPRPRLRRLLHLTDAGEFLREGWTERFFLARGPVERLAGLCDYDFDALCAMKTTYTRAFFPTDKGVKAIDLRPGQERPAYDAGATIYFHGLEGGRLGEWIEDLDSELGMVRGLTRVSAFASRSGKGLTPHYDLNDNFVCQARGRKRWRIAPNTHARFPLYGYTIGKPITPVHRAEAPNGLPTEMPEDHQTIELTPGTVMFVPRGMWHDTETTDESSLHFNIQSGLPTWRDLADFVLSRVPLECAADLRAPALGTFGADGVLTDEGARALEARLEQVLAALRGGDVRAVASEFHRYTTLRRTRLFEYPY